MMATDLLTETAVVEGVTLLGDRLGDLHGSPR